MKYLGIILFMALIVTGCDDRTLDVLPSPDYDVVLEYDGKYQNETGKDSYLIRFEVTPSEAANRNYYISFEQLEGSGNLKFDGRTWSKDASMSAKEKVPYRLVYNSDKPGLHLLKFYITDSIRQEKTRIIEIK